MYFMLSWRDHVRAASVMLFRMENRNAAYVTLGLIAAMIRSFIVGNFMIGLFLSAASMAAFGLMGLPYFYFLGVMSGFLSLIPYLGVVLAILPPVIVGLGYLTTATFLLTMRHRDRTASARHECALSDGAGKTVATQSPGRYAFAAVLGMAVGSHGTGAGRAADGRPENHLRQYQPASALWRMDGRIKQLALMADSQHLASA